MNKIIFISIMYFSESDFLRFGIRNYLKKKIEVEVWYLNKLVKNKLVEVNYKKKDFKLKNVKTIKIKNTYQFINQIKKNISNCLYSVKISYDFENMEIFKLLSKYEANYLVDKSPLAGIYNKNRLAGKYKTNIKLLNYFKYQFKKIIRGKFFYLKKIIINKFFLLFEPSFWSIKKANYAFLIGKYAYLSRKDHKLIGYKTKLIWGQHRDYDDYLRENTKKIDTKRKKALFIDQAIPYHPDRVDKLGVNFDPKEYYKSIRNFLERLNESFGYEIEISCCPRIQVHKLKKFFPKFKIEIGKTIKQIRNSSLVIVHHSNVINYAVIYKKPIIFITNNCLNNDFYYHYEEIDLRAKLFNKRCINIDEKPIFDIANYLKVNKKTYNNYLINCLKTKEQRKFQADIIFEKLKRDRVWI